ncbi:LCP family protein [Streptomyces orinoci]|uniref:LCP family protein n=1 Tax=Streptomyces orinoci TaxID=67339 RepID=A0ABV3K393_STRON|nr:LCP family protein [Streptomyces orinoci]
MADPDPSRPSRARHGVRRSPRWGLRVAAVISAGILATSGIGHAVVHRINRDIGRLDPFAGLSDRPRGSAGLNVLLVGTDSRDTITEEQRTRYKLGGDACHCTDTMMLVHLSADRDRASVVSLPRDTYTILPERTDRQGRFHPAHPQKLNAAYAEGGPSLTVRSVERLTGVHIDHYLEVDFSSFMKTVDLLGGVQVCTTRPLRDSYSGLDLPAGTSTLGGGQALQYVRARHVDGSSDLGRMRRQQRFVASLLHQVTSSGMLLNPVRFQQVATTLLGSVRADRGFGTEDLVELGRKLKDLSPASSEFTSVPVATVDFPVKGVGSTVKWDEPAAARIFQALREDRPIALPARRAQDGKPPVRPTPVEVAPSRIHVQVLNGTKRNGLGRTTDEALRATGFATTGIPGDAPPAPRTVIGFDPRWDRSVRTVAAALPGAELRAVPGQGPLVQVILGNDFQEVHPVRAAEPAPVHPTGNQVVTGDQVACADGT